MKTIALIFFAGAVMIAGGSASAGTGSLQMSHAKKGDYQKTNAAKQEVMAGAPGPTGKIGPATQSSESKRTPSLHR
jgi:hypothetical protein